MSLEDKASIVLPKGPAGQAGTLECWNPNSDSLVGLSVVRATTATRVNESGLIESVAANVPRRDFTNGGCGDLLVEPQRTNLVARSEEFDNATWTKTNLSVTANSTTSPDGNTTAEELTPDATNGNHRISEVFSASSGSTYSASIFAKANGYNFLQIVFNNAAFPNNEYANFDLSNGSVGSTSGGATASIESYGNGWYRCIFTLTADTTTGGVVNYQVQNADTASYLPSYSGDTTSGIFAWGAQLEAGSYATSYIPTVASTVTRNADVISGTGLAALFNQAEGAIYVEAAPLSNNNEGLFRINQSGGIVNQVRVGHSSALSFAARVSVAGVNQFNITTGLATENTFYKAIVRYAVNDFSLHVNGSTLNTDNSGITFTGTTLNTLDIPESVRVRELVIFNNLPSIPQANELTTP